VACRVESVGLRPLLSEDLELADAIPAVTRAAARPRVLAEVVELCRRSSGPDLAVPDAAGLGLLVLRGLLLQRLELVRKLSYELLGPGDLIPCGDEHDEPELLPHEVSWRALDDVRMAVLDEAFLLRAAPWPRLSNAIAARGLRRASSVSLERALTQHRVDVRVDLLLWHLAGRWGKVVGDGLIRLSLPVTHEVLAHLAGCSRPTATWALSRLTGLHLIQREKGGWLIQGSLQWHLSRLRDTAPPGSNSGRRRRADRPDRP
jgi:CRP-like cAMP-binding protein